MYRSMKSAPFETVLREYWSNSDNYRAKWSDRAKIAVTFLEKDERWICDIGCGPDKALRKLCGADKIYLGADLKKWDDSVAECNLNVPLLPELEVLSADCVFHSGVIEYLTNVPVAVEALANSVDVFIFSYCSNDASTDR